MTKQPIPRDIDSLAHWLDSSIEIPGTGYRIGWDPILGLVPGVGDLATTLLSSYIILRAARLGCSRARLLRMTANVGIEAVVGAVPIFGDIFDAAWKANLRNINLMKGELDHSASRAQDLAFLVTLALALLAIVLLPFVLIVLLVAAIV